MGSLEDDIRRDIAYADSARRIIPTLQRMVADLSKRLNDACLIALDEDNRRLDCNGDCEGCPLHIRRPGNMVIKEDTNGNC